MLLPYSPSSVAIAREHINADLSERGFGTRDIEDTSLAVSELVGNAIRHAYPLPSGKVDVDWWVDEDQVEVAVSDGGAASVPARGSLSLSVASGRGLGIVEHLAQAWGVRRQDDDVTTVWARIAARELVSAEPACSGQQQTRGRNRT